MGGTRIGQVSLGPNRGDSPTLGCPACGTYGTFQYTIFDPPDGHPVYNQPMPGVGWSNSSYFTFWGDPLNRPGGVKLDLSRWSKQNWSDPSTGVVHMFHSGLWGGWQFQISGADEGALYFGYGGYQEARGSSISDNHFYVENIKEELDTPGEWFYDAGSSELLLWPNTTRPLSGAVVAASLLSTLIDVRGSPGAPVTDVRVSGFELKGTRSTFMEMYEVPSGGDWSIHRSVISTQEVLYNVPSR